MNDIQEKTRQRRLGQPGGPPPEQLESSGDQTAGAYEPTTRAPLHTLMGVAVAGVGGSVPQQIVTNEDLSALGCDAEWIIRRTGIRERRRAAPGEATSDIALIAAEQAIERAGAKASDIDLIVVGTFTPDQPTPSTACILQSKLGIPASAAMDLNAACAGFMYALVTGAQFVASRTSRLALIVGADLPSQHCNPEDRKVVPIFGDGAGAALLAPGDREQGLLAYTLGADGGGEPLLNIRHGGTRRRLSSEIIAREAFIHMDGRPVFKWAVHVISDSTRDVLQHAGKRVEDVDLFVFHQANVRIIDAAVEALGIDRDRVVVNVDRMGNTSAASVPLALEEAVAAGRVERGDLVLLSGFGAGLAWGTSLLRW